MIPIRLGVLLAAAAPAIGLAHVRMSPAWGPPGSAYDGALVIGHGCKGSATREVSVEAPASLAARVGAPPGWTVEARSGPEGLSATWRGRGDPQVALALPIALRLPREPGPLYLIVRQTCDAGGETWSQIPAPGQDPHGLSRPAPVIRVGGEAPVEEMDGMPHPRP